MFLAVEKILSPFAIIHTILITHPHSSKMRLANFMITLLVSHAVAMVPHVPIDISHQRRATTDPAQDKMAMTTKVGFCYAISDLVFTNKVEPVFQAIRTASWI